MPFLSVCAYVFFFFLALIPAVRQRFNKHQTRIKGTSLYTHTLRQSVHIAVCIHCAPIVKTDWMTVREHDKLLNCDNGKRKKKFNWKICFPVSNCASEQKFLSAWFACVCICMHVCGPICCGVFSCPVVLPLGGRLFAFTVVLKLHYTHNWMYFWLNKSFLSSVFLFLGIWIKTTSPESLKWTFLASRTSGFCKFLSFFQLNF